MNCIGCTSKTLILTIQFSLLQNSVIDFMKIRIASSDIKLNRTFSTLYCDVNCHIICCKCLMLADTYLRSLVDVFYSVIRLSALR